MWTCWRSYNLVYHFTMRRDSKRQLEPHASSTLSLIWRKFVHLVRGMVAMYLVHWTSDWASQAPSWCHCVVFFRLQNSQWYFLRMRAMVHIWTKGLKPVRLARFTLEDHAHGALRLPKRLKTSVLQSRCSWAEHFVFTLILSTSTAWVYQPKLWGQ